MADNTLTIQITTEKVDTADFKKPGQDRENLNRISNYINSIATGRRQAHVDVSNSLAAPVAAAGTFTLVSAIATDVAVIGTITMTATSTPTTDLHWEIDGADDTADALSLATAINANPTLSEFVVATVAAGVVTVTAHQKGVLGNQVSISSVDSTITASGAFLTGGLGGAKDAPESISKT
tara:strand:- start:96 stop:635 length:540 start_codon:yes stop_codon:yes gene_type:complete